jgi:hypothetical protein
MTRSSEEIEQDIARTRQEMDETLNEVEERVQPRHLVDDLFESLRSSGSGGDLACKARDATRVMARQIKKHPVPALLCGAGLLWLLFEDDENQPRQRFDGARNLPEHSGSFVDALTGEPYGPGGTYRRCAWNEGYDWSDEDEQSWTEEARGALSSLQETLADTTQSVRDKMRAVAHKVRSLSGKKYQSNWRNLREHSGSFVDARTGQPYDETYGWEWREAEGLDYLADYECEHGQEDQGWSHKAEQALASIGSALADQGQSVKRRLSNVTSHLTDFADTARGRTADYGRQVRDRASHLASQTKQGAAQLASQTKQAGAAAYRQAREGYNYASDRVGEAVDEYPLAVGAACLGLGLLVGLAIPETSPEDRLMGDQADELKHKAKDAGREALHRGQHVAEETAYAAMDEAERQGLTPGQLGERFRDAAKHVAKTVQEEAEGTGGSLAEKAGHVAERAVETAKSETQREAKAATS